MTLNAIQISDVVAEFFHRFRRDEFGEQRFHGFDAVVLGSRMKKTVGDHAQPMIWILVLNDRDRMNQLLFDDFFDFFADANRVGVRRDRSLMFPYVIHISIKVVNR